MSSQFGLPVAWSQACVIEKWMEAITVGLIFRRVAGTVLRPESRGAPAAQATHQSNVAGVLQCHKVL